MAKVCLVVVLALVAVASGAFKCPKDNGEFEDAEQCDLYYKCVDGVATEKLCPDGLVFDPFNRKINKCDHIFNVDCEDRLTLQPPQPSPNCPRRNGFFPHPDPAVCDVFYNCIEAEATKNTCTVGLHFHPEQGICVWPDSAGRKGCRKVGDKLEDGFECPKEVQIDDRDMPVDHPKYAHPDDCQKFYICLSGVTPRVQGCSEGTVYNEETQKCDDPKNVPGCEHWYKEEEQKS